MRLRGFSKIGFATFACCGLAQVHQSAHAQTDAVFIQQSAPARPAPAANETPDYESDYAAAARLSGDAGNTPEADARPGEYYFLEGARAFRKKEYTFAIQMYQVSASWAYKPAEYNLAVMYTRGQGVPVDLPRGMAWIALASERNEQHYVDARDLCGTVEGTVRAGQCDLA
jgi:TPR repeat protein